MNDNPDNTAEEFLDWLCWRWANRAENFYPPKRTAKQCMDSLPEDKYEEGSTEYNEALAWEVGQHSRAYMEAESRFHDAENWGISPMERAAREHRDLMEKGEVDPIDWSWLGGDE